ASYAAYCRLVVAHIDRARAVTHVVDAERLAARLDRLREVTARLLAVADPVARLANASAYLEAFGHVAVAWVWLDQVLALDERDDDFARGKRQAARHVIGWEPPRRDA